MLGKLMKYEFKASGRILLPLYAAVIITGVLSGIAAKVTDRTFSLSNFFGIIGMIIMIMYFLFVVASLAVGFIIAILRFKKNLFDSEAYLMHTLPIDASTHIFSKLFVACIYEIAGVVAAVISAFFVVLPEISFENLDFSDMMYQLKTLFGMYGDAILLYLVEGILFCVAALIFINMIIYAAISIGHSTNSHKVRNSFGAYIVLYIIVQIGNSLALMVGPIDKLISNAANGIYSASPIMLFLIFINVAYSTVFFFITRYFMTNKLNLQ